MRISIFGQRAFERAALRAGDFGKHGFLINQRLHFGDEGLRAQINLPLQLAPYAGELRALMDKGNVFGDGAGALRANRA